MLQGRLIKAHAPFQGELALQFPYVELEAYSEESLKELLSF